MIAAVTPSRGLIHSRTAAAVLEQIRHRGVWMISHALPIPNCFEELTTQALSAGADAVWYVEEDVVPVPGTLELMLSTGSEVVLADYPLRRAVSDPRIPLQTPGPVLGRSAYCRIDGRMIWMGMGCLLVRREAFLRIPTPYFRSDARLFSSPKPGGGRRILMARSSREYGGQDIHFTFRLLAAGASCEIIECKTTHLPLEMIHLAREVYHGDSNYDCTGPD